MSQQTIKQRARRQALDVAARYRRQLVEREKRLKNLAIQVLTALGERDAAVAATERRAGAALQQMTDTEGLTLRQATEWCDELSVREATRLRRLADDTATDGTICVKAGDLAPTLTQTPPWLRKGPRARAGAGSTALGQQGTPSQRRGWESCRRSVRRSSGSTGTSSPTPPRRREVLLADAWRRRERILCGRSRASCSATWRVRPVRPSPAVRLCTPIMPRTSNSSARGYRHLRDHGPTEHGVRAW